MKLFTLTIISMFLCLSLQAAGITGTAPVDGGNYYIYNVYQAKYLSYGNLYDTQVSLDNNKPLLCTLEKSGGNYKINTHYSLTTNSYNADVTNYIINTDEGIFVNARWGVSDTDYNDREATKFAFVKADDGYYITCSGGSLMFDSGTACVVGNRSEGFNADKSLWRFVSADEYAEQASKKSFTVAALNVDGMPRTITVGGLYTVNLNSDGKEAAGATAIGQKLIDLGYDVIGVSEDFNYNDEIMAQIGSAYAQGTHRGKIETYTGILAKYLAKQNPV